MLAEVLAESREFAMAFSAQIDRTPKNKKIIKIVEDVSNIKVYEASTKQFDDAVQILSSGLLDLLDSQFNSKPAKLIVGGLSKPELSDDESFINYDEMSLFEDDYAD